MADTTAAPWWPPMRRFVGGYFSGVALVLAGHPFDTIKVRLQTETTGRFGGPIDCLRQTIKREGFLAIYKGVLPPLLATGVINSILFGVQGSLVHTIVAHRSPENESRKPQLLEVCSAAVLSGAFISLLVTPMEDVKSRMQVDYAAKANKAQPSTSRGALTTLRSVAAGPSGLVRGLYRGLLPTALCRMSNYSYFGAYHVISQIMPRPPADGSIASRAAALGITVLGGGAAGVCYWLSCYPIDVIKNRIMADDAVRPRYRGMLDAARQIYAESGVRGFFRGFSPCAMRAVPANAACFLAYEGVMKLLPERL